MDFNKFNRNPADIPEAQDSRSRAERFIQAENLGTANSIRNRATATISRQDQSVISLGGRGSRADVQDRFSRTAARFDRSSLPGRQVGEIGSLSQGFPVTNNRARGTSAFNWNRLAKITTRINNTSEILGQRRPADAFSQSSSVTSLQDESVGDFQQEMHFKIQNETSSCVSLQSSHCSSSDETDTEFRLGKSEQKHVVAMQQCAASILQRNYKSKKCDKRHTTNYAQSYAETSDRDSLTSISTIARQDSEFDLFGSSSTIDLSQDCNVYRSFQSPSECSLGSSTNTVTNQLQISSLHRQGLTSLPKTETIPISKHNLKQYYSSQIYFHISTIQNEIVRLREQIPPEKHYISKYELTKQQLEKSRVLHIVQQEKLLILQSAIKLYYSSDDQVAAFRSKVETLGQTNEGKRTYYDGINLHNIKGLQNMFQKLMQNIRKEQKLNVEKMVTMPKEIQDKMKELEEDLVELQEKKILLQYEMDEASCQIKEYEPTIADNQELYIKYLLQKSLAEAPVLKNKFKVEFKYLTTIENEIQDAKNELVSLHQYDTALNHQLLHRTMKKDSKLAKYIELKRREKIMHSFFKKYPKVAKDMYSKFSRVQNEIEYVIEYISVSSEAKSTVWSPDNDIFNVNPNMSKTEVINLIAKLKRREKWFDHALHYFKTSIVKFRKQKRKYLDRMEHSVKLEDAKDDLCEQIKELNASKTSLITSLENTHYSYLKKVKKLKEVDIKLKTCISYSVYEDLKSKIRLLSTENSEMKDKIDTILSIVDYIPTMEECLEELKEVQSKIQERFNMPSLRSINKSSNSDDEASSLCFEENSSPNIKTFSELETIADGNQTYSEEINSESKSISQVSLMSQKLDSEIDITQVSPQYSSGSKINRNIYLDSQNLTRETINNNGPQFPVSSSTKKKNRSSLNAHSLSEEYNATLKSDSRVTDTKISQKHLTTGNKKNRQIYLHSRKNQTSHKNNSPTISEDSHEHLSFKKKKKREVYLASQNILQDQTMKKFYSRPTVTKHSRDYPSLSKKQKQNYSERVVPETQLTRQLDSQEDLLTNNEHNGQVNLNSQSVSEDEQNESNSEVNIACTIEDIPSEIILHTDIGNSFKQINLCENYDEQDQDNHNDDNNKDDDNDEDTNVRCIDERSTLNSEKHSAPESGD